MLKNMTNIIKEPEFNAPKVNNWALSLKGNSLCPPCPTLAFFHKDSAIKGQALKHSAPIEKVF